MASAAANGAHEVGCGGLGGLGGCGGGGGGEGGGMQGKAVLASKMQTPA